MSSVSREALKAVRDYIVDDNGCRLEQDYFGNQVISAAEEFFSLQQREQAPSVALLEFFERQDDMGLGRLRMIMDGDSDVIIEIIDKEGHSLALEFCTSFSGGGRSPKVREALLNVMKAIREENAGDPVGS